uniref:Senescence domain-containing protein n=1 Tax=Steinernema glaseri TaxID=37863 RepID=A0A1I8AH82_9BILA
MKALILLLFIATSIQAGFFDDAWSTITDSAKNAYDSTKDAAASVANSDFGRAVGGVATDVGDTIASGAKTAWEKTSEVASDAYNSETGQTVAKGAKETADKVVDAAKDAGNFVADKAVAAKDTVIESVKT